MGTRTRGLYCILSREICLSSCAFARAGCCAPLVLSFQPLVHVLAPLVFLLVKQSLLQLLCLQSCVLLFGKFAHIVSFQCLRPEVLADALLFQAVTGQLLFKIFEHCSLVSHRRQAPRSASRFLRS